MSEAPPLTSFIVPARNEEALIGACLTAILASVARAEGVAPDTLHLGRSRWEVLVVDDGSTDRTRDEARRAGAAAGVRLLDNPTRGCARARNWGTQASRGAVLCYVDADTLVPAEAAERVLEWVARGKCAGIFKLVSLEPGFQAQLWWSFWGLMRHLPLARAKSMPAFMFCTREHFDRYGPFHEDRAIAEEWALLVPAYRNHRAAFVYDTAIAARTSSRRMQLQPFGYLRTFAKWTAAVLFPWARRTLPDHIRHRAPAE